MRTMKAKQLAKKLNDIFDDTLFLEFASEMLREQADQIKKLEEECAALREQLNETQL